MENFQIIDLTPETIGDYGVCGYKDAKKHKELRNKIDWFKKFYPQGLRIKALIADDYSYQGMIEYIPGELAHRPVEATGYMFIHCLFVGFRKEYKGKGFATALIDECIMEARQKDLKGVAVVTRKGSFMVSSEIFKKKGFNETDRVDPDFSLYVLKFNAEYKNPCFRAELKVKTHADKFKKGLTILKSSQCPYTEKNVNAILESAKKEFKLETQLVNMQDVNTIQQTPCAFGTFCILLDGKVISYHPISKTRFENIMKKEMIK